jgi:beta-glucosidase/6-phospho-beta-glucosidase/beta-galactosidase
VERTGPGARFWELFPEDLEYASRMGCNAFRLGIEWARIQPEADPESRRLPQFDDSALNRYAVIIARCRELGMVPVVTLFHFTHPLWLGLDPWLDGDKMIRRFTDYVDYAVSHINNRLINYHGVDPISYYITINEPVMAPLASYLFKMHPKGEKRGGKRDFIASFENILIAHLAAYRKIHEIYQRNQWPKPTVTTNTWTSYVYPMDMMVQDILLAPTHGIGHEDFYYYLSDRKKNFYDRLRHSPCRMRLTLRQRAIERLALSLMDRMFGRRPFPRLIEKVLSGSLLAPWMDVLAFDYYDPFPGDYLAIDSPVRIRLKKDPWEWGMVPDGLGGFLDVYSSAVGKIPLHIVENGMAYACKREGMPEPRPDGANRVDVLKAHLFECLCALNRGVQLGGYFYWTLSDNYEWGSFTPRFGMLGVDYVNGARRSPLDIAGNNAAGAYQAIIQAFFQKDKVLLREAFRATEYPLLF